MTISIIDFLEARLAKDEEAARAAADGPWGVDKDGEVYQTNSLREVPCTRLDGSVYTQTDQINITRDSEGMRPSVQAEDAAHIARHDPARVLREIEATRYLVARYKRKLKSLERHKGNYARLHADIARAEETGTWEADYDRHGWTHSLQREEDYLVPMTNHFEALVQYQAAVYSNHPEYRPEWKPTS